MSRFIASSSVGCAGRPPDSVIQRQASYVTGDSLTQHGSRRMGGLEHVARRRRLCADLFAVDDFREAVRRCCSACPRHLATPRHHACYPAPGSSSVINATGPPGLRNISRKPPAPLSGVVLAREPVGVNVGGLRHSQQVPEVHIIEVPIACRSSGETEPPHASVGQCDMP